MLRCFVSHIGISELSASGGMKVESARFCPALLRRWDVNYPNTHVCGFTSSYCISTVGFSPFVLLCKWSQRVAALTPGSIQDPVSAHKRNNRLKVH